MACLGSIRPRASLIGFVKKGQKQRLSDIAWRRSLLPAVTGVDPNSSLRTPHAYRAGAWYRLNAGIADLGR